MTSEEPFDEGRASVQAFRIFQIRSRFQDPDAEDRVVELGVGYQLEHRFR